MPKLKKQDVQTANKELNAVLANDKVLSALEEVGDDEDALDKAKANPKAFLKKRGVEVPRNVKLEIMDGNHSMAKARGITICVRACVGGNGWAVCGEVCFSWEV
jgi:hypothetical protein